jgi:hypothetical protein
MKRPGLWRRFVRSIKEMSGVWRSTDADRDRNPKCVCGHRLSEHSGTDPGQCLDRECDCREFEEAKDAR